MPNDHYNINNETIPHHEQVIRFTNGNMYRKTIPEDKDKDSHEEHVLKVFALWYGKERYRLDPVDYSVVGRDNDGTQIHDFTVHFENGPDENLPIEITKFSDSEQSHISHALRDKAMSIQQSRKRHYFCFLPFTTQPRDLESLFTQADSMPPISPPKDTDSDELMDFINTLIAQKEPFVRRSKNKHSQFHTFTEKSVTLRESLETEIKKKEGKEYSPFQQKDMVLLLDDKSLLFSRFHIDSQLEMLNYYFINSSFNEIYVISRMSGEGDAGESEFMIFPVKAPWHLPTRNNLIYAVGKIREGVTLPLNF